MRVSLLSALNDTHIDANQTSSQRQLALSIAANSEAIDRTLPLNLCLILDHSGSMGGKPLETVKEAAINLLQALGPDDRFSVVAFDHEAKVIVPNQSTENINSVITQIKNLKAKGGTAIDKGLKLGIQEAAGAKLNRVSHIFLLTDGENEHGDNEKCLKLAQLASEYGITVNSLGFGAHWNQDILEKVADLSGGSLSYIEQPETALAEFTRLFTRLQSVGLTNAFLEIELDSRVRLAELKPVAQVAPETIELTAQQENNFYNVRLGDILVDQEKIILVNLYLNQLAAGNQTIARVRVRYDDPATEKTGLYSETLPVNVESQGVYSSQINDKVQKSVLTLAKYRQTQIAEDKLKQGDRIGAATMLQTAANTAIKLGETNAATVLQSNATRLQVGENLSEADLKKTRILSKTRLQDDGKA
ncbi:MAG: hypothetical protein N5P05_003184 [Chroococcopsis gigantea SAG 12.99]|jgi:Ca-activated chloride channel family protein|nr:VWA domain-containing protein [Chlorogloea purpurea SAG 13.99]MDV3001578.1 hypothetical protein [Chroococcopsis gigantea SAG 12.99]